MRIYIGFKQLATLIAIHAIVALGCVPTIIEDESPKSTNTSSNATVCSSVTSFTDDVNNSMGNVVTSSGNSSFSFSSFLYLKTTPTVSPGPGFLSRVMDSCTQGAVWKNLAWKSTLPFQKELLNSGVSETTSNYSGLANSTLMNGILGLWHFNQTSWTGAANEVIDSSGNGNHGTIGAGATITSSGYMNNGGSFDGSTTGKISLPGTFPNFTDASLFTVAAWVNATDVGWYKTIISNINGSNVGWDFFINSNALGTQLIRSWPGNYIGATSPAIINTNSWYHVAMTYDGTRSNTSVKFYINGISQTVTMGNNTLTGSFAGTLNPAIGGRPIGAPAGSLQPFPGKIDEIGVWSRVLSAPEILTLYRRGANRVKVQVRAWDTSNYPNCVNGTEVAGSACPNFVGPSGSTSAYFSELTNTSATAPSVILQGITGRFFQYKATLESDDSSVNFYSPDLSSVTVSQ